ncbi:MAG: hypothetical protein HYZ53_18680 [Planctomycetes bacterium]|nr:hypothetical protein [Planctomycetota bacterium]
MPTTKQMNVRVSSDLLDRIQAVSAFLGKSMNAWTTDVLAEAVRKEHERLPVDELRGKVARLAERYLPGRAVGVREMLAMADGYAEEERADGLGARHASSAGGRRKVAARMAVPAEPAAVRSSAPAYVSRPRGGEPQFVKPAPTVARRAEAPARTPKARRGGR